MYMLLQICTKLEQYFPNLSISDGVSVEWCYGAKKKKKVIPRCHLQRHQMDVPNFGRFISTARTALAVVIANRPHTRDFWEVVDHIFIKNCWILNCRMTFDLLQRYNMTSCGARYILPRGGHFLLINSKCGKLVSAAVLRNVPFSSWERKKVFLAVYGSFFKKLT